MMDIAVSTRPEDQKPSIGRNVGVDFLRVLAIFLICLFHAVQTVTGIVDSSEASWFVRLAIRVLTPLGGVGNLLFIICSSHYLCDKRKSKLDKILTLVFDCSFISIAILCGFLLGGYRFDSSTMLHQIFPTVYAQNWFVPCYIVFYCFAPIIGTGLKTIGKKGHLIYCLAAALIYGVTFAMTWPVGDIIGCQLVEFFLIFGLVSFAKWHMKRFSSSRKANIVVLFAGLAVSVGLHALCVLLSNRFPILTGKFYSVSFRNPVFVIAMIALFNLFKSAPFKNRFVSYLGSCTLFVYVIHENFLLKTYTRVEYYQLVFDRYGTDHFLLWALLCGMFMFIVGFLLAAIYGKTIHRFMNWAATKTSLGISTLFEKAYLKWAAPTENGDSNGDKTIDNQ